VTFRRFLCWSAEDARVVLNTTAEYSLDEVFLATHTAPTTLLLANNPREPSAGVHETSPEDLLAEFLADRADISSMVVVGRPGTGKSHLIHWLKLKIPTTTKRAVLSIPRSGVSLFGVLTQLVAMLPSPEQRPFLEKLGASGFEPLTHERKLMRIRVELGTAIKEDEIGDAADPDLEKQIAAGLSAVFLDPNFAEHLERPGGPVEKVVDLLSLSTERDDDVGTPEFTARDLAVGNYELKKSSESAQWMLRRLRHKDESDEEMRIALRIVNRNMPTAVGRVLHMDARGLSDLFRSVRRSLGAKGMEFVLLIEDAVRMQAIDKPLFAALIDPGTVADGQCRIRWAMAITTGYYSSVGETVQDRVRQYVDMDGSSKDLLDQGINVPSFALPYLNAVRLGPEKLADWNETGLSSRPDSKCATCPKRPECFAAFGSSDGIGFYPFNENALVAISQRTSTTGLTPRDVVKFVLQPVLDQDIRAIAEGEFPDKAFVDRLGGSRLSVFERDFISRANPRDAVRQLAILEFWGREAPKGVYEAFDVTEPDLSLLPDTVRTPPTPETGVAPGSKPQVRKPSGSVIDELEAWTTGAGLSESAVLKLRATLHQVVASFIDWERLGLIRADFVSRSEGRAEDVTLADFRPRTFNFRRSGDPLPAPVRVMVPAVDSEDAYRRFVLAFTTLEEFETAEEAVDASLSKGLDMFAALAEELESIGESVSTQIAAIVDGDSAHAGLRSQAAELLLLGAALAGARLDTVQGLDMSAAFSVASPDRVGASPAWGRLQELFAQKRAATLRAARNLLSAPKGSSVRAGFIDPVPLLAAWERLRVKPESSRSGRQSAAFKVLDELSIASAGKLLPAAREEHERQQVEAKKIIEELGDDSSSVTLDAIRLLREAASDAGLGPSRQTEEQLAIAMSSADAVVIEAGLSAARAVINLALPQAFWILGTNFSAAHRSWVFAVAAARYLSEISTRVEREFAEDANSPDSVSAILDKTIGDLEWIGERLNSMK
jgi:hypothetical protein